MRLRLINQSRCAQDLNRANKNVFYNGHIEIEIEEGTFLLVLQIRDSVILGLPEATLSSCDESLSPE